MKKAVVNINKCVSCGACSKICPKNAIKIFEGIYAKVDDSECVGCSKCQKECPAGVIDMEEII